MKKITAAIIFLLVPTWCLAEAGDTRVVEIWNCTLKDGKTVAEVEAHNAKWLALARQTSAEVNSYGMERIVGEDGTFMFADVYPDLATWAAVKNAMDTEAGSAMEQGFGDLIDCNSNRLYKSTEHG